MGAYIARRLLLIIPTLLGVMLINFFLVQFVPGGPIEQVIARMEGQGNVFGAFDGGRRGCERGRHGKRTLCRRARVATRIYRRVGTRIRLRQTAARTFFCI